MPIFTNGFFDWEILGDLLRVVHLVSEAVRERLNYAVQLVKSKELFILWRDKANSNGTIPLNNSCNASGGKSSHWVKEYKMSL